MNEPVRVLMVAINGYGHYYLKSLLGEVSREKAVLAGVIDPEAERSEYFHWIRESRIPLYNTIEEFFINSHKADLTVISSPPQYHIEQAITALKNKSNVLIDKPVGIGEESVRRLIKTARKNKRWVEVGFQWSFSSAIQNLKADIINGLYGPPFEYKSICLWPREYEYYNRNKWAGRKKDDTGRLVLDSPASNACAHFLHNLLFLCGDKMESSGTPAGGNSYKYRAYPIDNFDTVSLDLITVEGVQILFYASHATEQARNPEFNLRFADGFVRYDDPEKGIIGVSNLFGIKNYGSPDDDNQFKKLFHSIDRILREKSAVCPPESAIAHTITVDIMDYELHLISDISESKIIDDGKRRWVKGLNEIFNEAYDNNKMIKI